MRQENNRSSNQGNQARPSDRATLAGRLQSLHHADMQQGAKILAEFAGAEMQDASFTGGHGGTYSEAEELGATILAVLWGSNGKDFSGLIPDYLKLVALVRTFLVRQGGNNLAIAQLDRITQALAVDNADAARIAPAPAPSPIQRPSLRQLIRDRAVIAAAVCLALLLFDLTSDHFPMWHLLAAIALVAAVCPAMFRIGAKHGRDVLTAVERKS